MATTTSRGIKLDAHTQERLQALGRKRDRSPHYLMKVAIESFLNREEAVEREKQEDHERWERFEMSGEGVSQERALTWLRALAQGQTDPCPL